MPTRIRGGQTPTVLSDLASLRSAKAKFGKRLQVLDCAPAANTTSAGCDHKSCIVRSMATGATLSASASAQEPQSEEPDAVMSGLCNVCEQPVEFSQHLCQKPNTVRPRHACVREQCPACGAPSLLRQCGWDSALHHCTPCRKLQDTVSSSGEVELRQACAEPTLAPTLKSEPCKRNGLMLEQTGQKPA